MLARRQLLGEIGARRLRQEHQRPHAGRRKLDQRDLAEARAGLREQRLEHLLHGLVDRPHDRHAVEQALRPSPTSVRPTKLAVRKPSSVSATKAMHQAGARDRPGQIGLRPVDRRNERAHEIVDPGDERPDQPDGDRQRPGDHQAGEEIIADAAGEAGMRRRSRPPRDVPLGLLVDFGHRAQSYSTVTDFARLRGWSTSVPMATAV